MAKIVFVSDMDFRGSGYLKVSIPLCEGLSKHGHNIYVIGLNYEGQEHDFPFKIIPAKSFQEVHAMLINLKNMEHPDLVIVALDIPHHMQMVQWCKKLEYPYIAITPLENPPLTMSWAAPLLSADMVYFISETGAEAAKKAGLIYAEHIQIGLDENWKIPTKEERERIRKGMGFEGKYVVLTIADNQERKNLSASLEIIREAKKLGADNLKYILVTREHLMFGWKLRDLATEYGINDELVIIERGIPFSALWTYYAAADLYLLTSKAEGLGLPVLESMGCGVPVLAAKTGAIPELLADGRGYTIPIKFSFVDVWGNGRRDMVNVKAGAKLLRELMQADNSDVISKAKKYVDGRTWNIPTNQLNNKIEEILNGTTKN